MCCSPVSNSHKPALPTNREACLKKLAITLATITVVLAAVFITLAMILNMPILFSIPIIFGVATAITSVIFCLYTRKKPIRDDGSESTISDRSSVKEFVPPPLEELPAYVTFYPAPRGQFDASHLMRLKKSNEWTMLLVDSTTLPIYERNSINEMWPILVSPKSQPHANFCETNQSKFRSYESSDASPHDVTISFCQSDLVYPTCATHTKCVLAVVNAANPQCLTGQGGTNAAISKAVSQACWDSSTGPLGTTKQPGDASIGSFEYSRAYPQINYEQQPLFLIQAHGVKYTQGCDLDAALESLTAAYLNSFALAREAGVTTLHTPLLASGSYAKGAPPEWRIMCLKALLRAYAIELTQVGSSITHIVVVDKDLIPCPELTGH